MLLHVLTQRLDEDTARHVLRILAATIVQAAARRALSRRRAGRERMMGRVFHYGSGRYYTWEVYFGKVERGELRL